MVIFKASGVLNVRVGQLQRLCRMYVGVVRTTNWRRGGHSYFDFG